MPTPPSNQRERRRIGAVLVALQFFWIAVLAVLALLARQRWALHWPAGVVFGAGIALMLWAVAAHRPGSFSIQPLPRAGGRLVTHGPYRQIRHPMYSAVLLCGVGAALAAGSALSWGALAALAVVLWIKASFEERWMAELHAGYAAYRTRTRRFIPGIF